MVLNRTLHLGTSWGGGGFTPASLTPDLWLAADDISTMFQDVAGSSAVTTNGQTVGTWNDKSGNGFHLTATADDTTRPTYGTTDFTHVSFDGSNDKLRRAASLGMVAAGATSIFLACRPNPGTTRDLISEDRSSTGVPFYRPFESGGADATDVQPTARNDASSVWVNFGNPSPLLGDGVYDNTDKVIGFIDTGTNIKLYDDGIQVGTQDYTRSGILTFDQFVLMARIGGGAAAGWFAGRVYELVVVKRAIDATERADLTTYLGAKIGLTI